MATSQKTLWKKTGINLCISVAIYGTLLLLLWLAELLFPALKGQLLHFDNPAWIVGIPASTIGVAYVLSIKDPQNFTGFYAGIVMSVLLGVQFLLQKQYDSTVLYFCVFIPFQIKSILAWSKSQESAAEAPAPEFLSTKQMWLTHLIFLFIIIADYLFATYLQHNALWENWAVKFCNGLIIASSIFANFWLIYRKNDSWIYWVVYSLSGIALFIILDNIFSIVLFSFFLVINSIAGVAWIKMTPRENYGWLKRRLRNK